MPQIEELSPQSVVDAAHRIACSYSPVHRYSADAYLGALQLLADHAMYPPKTLLDLGAGPGMTVHLLRSVFPSDRLVALDISYDMLRSADKGEWNLAVAGRAEQLPFHNGVFDIVLCSLAIHLFSRAAALHEVARVSRKSGLFAVIGYDRADHAGQVFMKHFPEYASGELSRHPTDAQLCELAATEGYTLVDRGRFAYSVRFASVGELLNFVERRPFFGMQLLSDTEFRRGFEAFSRKVQSVFGAHEILSESAITVWVFRRP